MKHYQRVIHFVVAIHGWIRLCCERFWHATCCIYKRQSADHIVFLAAGLAYYSLIALVPISAISLSMFASFINDEQQVIYDKMVNYFFPLSPELRLKNELADELAKWKGEEGIAGSIPLSATESVVLTPSDETLRKVQEEFTQSIHTFVEQAKKLRWLGLVLMIVSGIWLFDSIEDAFNRIWRSELRRPFLDRFKTFWMVLTLAPVCMVGPMILDRYLKSTRIPSDLEWFPYLYSGIWGLAPYVLTWLAIWLLYVVVPNGTVSRGPAAIGALLIALVWEGAKRGFVEYVVRSESYMSVYGSLSVIIFIFAWIFLTWWLLLLGLEITAYLQFPHWDETLPNNELAPEIRMLYTWGGLYEAGKSWLRGQGGASTDSISQSLGLDPALTSQIMETLEDRNLLARDRKGNWYPAVPLERITWADVAALYPVQKEATSITLSDWLDAALQGRGLRGYHQDTRELPTLDSILRQRLHSTIASPTLSYQETSENQSGNPSPIDVDPVSS